VFHDVSPFGLLGISRLTLVRRRRRGERRRWGSIDPRHCFFIATYGCKYCLGWLHLQQINSEVSLNGCDAHNVSHSD
jgi:hypothetical protein